jgi:hypothetical protein
LEDPNNPVDNAKPSDANCEPEVLTRVISATEKVRRTTWSEPTDTVVVPIGHRVLVQSVEAPNLAAVGARQIRIERKATDEPLANLMTLTWKVDGPYDVPVVLKVGRGAVLNGTADKTEAVDPVAGRVRTLSGYRFTTDAIVLDVYGGFSPPGLPPSPGFMLVRTADGRLEFHSESSDFAAVKKNTIPPPEEEPKVQEEKPEEGRPEEMRFEEDGRDRPRRSNRVR